MVSQSLVREEGVKTIYLDPILECIFLNTDKSPEKHLTNYNINRNLLKRDIYGSWLF